MGVQDQDRENGPGTEHVGNGSPKVRVRSIGATVT